MLDMTIRIWFLFTPNPYSTTPNRLWNPISDIFVRSFSLSLSLSHSRFLIPSKGTCLTSSSWGKRTPQQMASREHS